MVSFLAVLTSMTLNDIEPPKKGFREFFTILDCDPHFKGELSRNG